MKGLKNKVSARNECVQPREELQQLAPTGGERRTEIAVAPSWHNFLLQGFGFVVSTLKVPGL
jgi:hypothetical protein